MVCLSRSNLIIRVTTGKANGTIYVREGQIHHAQAEGSRGSAALFEMLRWKDGRFEMLPYEDVGINTLDQPGTPAARSHAIAG